MPDSFISLVGKEKKGKSKDKTQIPDSINEKHVPIKNYDDKEFLDFCNAAISLQEQSNFKNNLNMFAIKHGTKIFKKTRTDMIGALNHGSMFLLSKHQWNKLMKEHVITSQPKQHHIDLGSGSGEVLIPLAASIESSPYQG